MQYSQILQKAWHFAANNKKLVWFAFLPSFVTVLIFVAESTWQGFFMFEEFGKLKQGTFFRGLGNISHFLSDYQLWGWFILLVFFVLLISFVLPSLIQSTIILSVRQRFLAPDKKLSLRQKIIEGGAYFFKLFEFHAIVSPFSFLTIIFYFLAFYRYTHGDTSNFVFTLLIIFSIIAVFVNFFLAYTPFFIVCEKESLASAIRKSIGFVFLNFSETLGLTMLMLLVNLRVIVNVLVVFGIPTGLIVLASSFAVSKWFSLIIGLGIIVGVFMLGVAAYLTSILELFSLCFWERAFVKLREKQKNLEFSEDEAPEEEIETIVAERVNNYDEETAGASAEPEPVENLRIAEKSAVSQVNQNLETKNLTEDSTVHFKIK